MALYRKKPVIIEARQFVLEPEPWGNITELTDWMLSKDTTARFHEGIEFSDLLPRIFIDTLEGTMAAIPGDYIIRGVRGEFYPCKLEIFEATYELVEG